MKRHPDLKLRKSEPTAAVRHQGIDWEVVKSYFEAIRLTLIKTTIFSINLEPKFGTWMKLELSFITNE